MSESKLPGLQLLMLLGASICCSFVGSAIGQIFLLVYYNEQIPEYSKIDAMPLLVTVGVGQLFAHVLTFFVFLRGLNFTLRDLFPKIKFSARHALLLPLVGFGGLIFVGWLSALSLDFFENSGQFGVMQDEFDRQQLLTGLLVHENVGQLLLSILVLAILPAVGEELIYRGILQTRIALATKNMHFAVLISALIFAAMHFQPVNLLAITAMGILLGYVFFYTRNIWMNILLHFMFNGFQILQLYFWPELVDQI